MLDYKKLMEKANEMRKTSYVPYSHFRVGAVLVTKDGKEYTGCNFENASFPATVCAERTAFAKAISEGEREFACIAIVGGREFTFLRSVRSVPSGYVGVLRQRFRGCTRHSRQV
jgi:cytidine deaminase